MRSLEQFIQTVKDQNNFWRFLISNKLEQLEFKREIFWGIRNMQEKLEKSSYFHDSFYDKAKNSDQMSRWVFLNRSSIKKTTKIR